MKPKTKIVIKLKNINCDGTKKLQLWWNLKTQIVINFKSSLWWNSNSNCDEIQKLQWSQNSKTQIVTTQKLELWQNSNCERRKKSNSKCELKLLQTQKLVLLQNSTTQIVSKTQFVRKHILW